jgi:hypothetical protein
MRIKHATLTPDYTLVIKRMTPIARATPWVDSKSYSWVAMRIKHATLTPDYTLVIKRITTFALSSRSATGMVGIR